MTNSRLIALGGSIIYPQSGPNGKVMKEYTDIIKGTKTGTIIGGGTPCRARNEFLNQHTKNHTILDWSGIYTTRANAELLIGYMDGQEMNVNIKVPDTLNEAIETFKQYQYMVMGGLVPGQTTNAVLLQIANASDIKTVINVSNVDGIYTADPRKEPNATRIPVMNHERLTEMFGQGESIPGQNVVIDQVAVKLACEHNTTMFFISGKDFNDLRTIMEHDNYDELAQKIINDEIKFSGTLVIN